MFISPEQEQILNEMQHTIQKDGCMTTVHQVKDNFRHGIENHTHQADLLLLEM